MADLIPVLKKNSILIGGVDIVEQVFHLRYQFHQGLSQP
jgi:hypothetical protein